MSRLGAALLVLITGAFPAFEAAASELADTSWRLVEIQSMDDSVDAPDDRTKYTMKLKADGTATMQADCNRGNGSWTSKAPGQLQFGPVTSSRALCLPGSLSETYLAQFEWVRSYVLKGGHLFLATMADGSIVEFEPAGDVPPAATVLGKDVYTADAAEMRAVFLTRLFDQYAAERGIEAEAAEIDAFVENMRRRMKAKGLTAESERTREEAAELDAMGRAIGRHWKINKALYEQYGGRVIYQQLGPSRWTLTGGFLNKVRPRTPSHSMISPWWMGSGVTSPMNRSTTSWNSAVPTSSGPSQLRLGRKCHEYRAAATDALYYGKMALP